MNQVSLTVNQASLTVSASPPVSVCGGGQPQGTQLAVVGIGSEEGKSSGGGSGVSTVTISSLSLDVSSKTDRISAVEEDDEDEEVGMKIALETPTPQPSANETKTFSLFQATPSTTTTTEETVEDETGSAPVVEKEEDDVGKSVTEGGSAENNKPQEVSEKEKKEVVSEDGAASSNDLISTSESLEPPVSGVATSSETEQAPTIPSTSEPTPASSETTTAANSDSVTTELKTYSPPPMTLPSSSPAGGCLPEAAVSQEAAEGHHKEPEVAMESEPEEGDSDYDAYLDQLDEEEDGEEPSKSSLVGAIGVSLLQNNPLDEDFPAIDPTNESQPSSNRDVSLKALLAGSFDTSNTKGKAPKSARRKKKEAEWWSRHKEGQGNTSKPPRTTTTTSPTIKPPCKFFLNSFCKQGDACQFSHDVTRPKKKEMCKFYLQDSCTKGDNCRYIHGEYPCKFFHTATSCKNGDSCKFSHSPLTEESRELLVQILDPPRKVAGEAAAVPLNAMPTSATIPVLSNDKGLQFHPGVVQAQFFSAGDTSGSLLVPTESPSLASPLLISIPKQVLDQKTLVVSIPRQKLGPPFGTVPINALPVAAPNQTSTLPPPVLPSSSAAQMSVSPSQLFAPSVQSQSTALPPSQSFPPGNLPPGGPPISFPLPPRPNPAPSTAPPQLTGWPTTSNQPVPLFPPIGVPQNLPGPPQGPPQVPVAPQVPPQFLVPSSERKGLLPTPPSHMRLDPQNIQWTEDTDKTQYWEATNRPFPVSTSQQPPPPSGQFGNGGGLPPGGGGGGGLFGPPPPPPHGPHGAAVAVVDSALQQKQLFNEQQGVPARVDPRQTRMDSRPGVGSSMDPRRVGSGQMNPPGVGGDPRHHVGGAPGLPRPPLPTFQAPPPPGGQRQQWLQLPPPSAPHGGPTPISQTSGVGMGPGAPPLPLTGGSLPGQLQAFQIPPGGGPFLPTPPRLFPQPQPHLPPPTHVRSSQPAAHLPGSQSLAWGPGAQNSSTAAPMSLGSGGLGSTSSVGAPTGQRDGEMTCTPPRVDPRTKYSHLKIKPKGAPSLSGSSGSGGGQKGEGGTADVTGGAGERTHMPKLLQEPPPVQRPFDPRELFDSAASREVSGSEYQVSSGPFGTTFGSFFTRSSSDSGAPTTDSLQYGEITMTSDRDSGKSETNAATATNPEESEAKKEELNSTKTTVVPSYLAELGVGESDLMIDSAFSSLDKKDGTGGQDGSSRGTESTTVTAKKLPNIFGLGSGTL